MMAPKPISRRPRTQAQEPDNEFHSDSIFDVLGPDGGTPEPKRQTRNAQAEPSVADLMAKLQAQQDRIDSFERSSAMATSYSQPAVQVQQSVAIKEPVLNLEDLPDPVTNAKEYAGAIAQRTIAYQRDMADYAKKTTAATQAPKLGDPDALWEDFTEQHPEYVEDDSRIKFATAEVVARLAKRGVDVQKFMYTHSDQMFKQITDEYDKVFGSPQDTDDGQEIEPLNDSRPPQRPRQAARRMDQDDGDDGRSESIMGGGDRPGVRQGPAGSKSKGLIDDLQDIQRKTGYF